ncbi:MAG: kelch repeat-containing protein, partial [Polyangiaceae bacterium]
MNCTRGTATALALAATLATGCPSKVSERSGSALSARPSDSSTADHPVATRPSLDMAPGRFHLAGSLAVARNGFSLTALADGGALLVGGEDMKRGTTAKVDRFDAKTQSWQPAAPLAVARHQHAAILSSENTLLISGGIDVQHRRLASAALWSTTTKTWRALADMTHARSNHGSLRLEDGRVLVVGGRGSDDRCTAACEMYNPRSGVWEAAAPLPSVACDVVLLSLGKNRVHAFGGQAKGALQGLSIYDVAANSWKQGVAPPVRRIAHGVTALDRHRVMLTGGDSQRGPLASNELYDDRRRAYRPLSAMPEPRNSHCATRLANGEILITGGSSPTQSQLPSALVFSPNSNVWHNLPPMPEARAGHRAEIGRAH